MAYTTTTRLGLKKAVPGSNQPFETAVFNENYDKIDAETVAADARLDNLEAGLDTINTTQTARITALEAADVALDGRLDTIEGQNLNTRLTAAESLNTTQTTRLNGIDTLNTTQNTRLDAIETLNSTQNGRLTAVETKNTTQDTRLAVLEIAAGYPPLDFTVDGGTP